MTKRLGKQTIKFDVPPVITASAAVVGDKEGEGPLRDYFDYISADPYFGEKTWEKAESTMLKQCFYSACDKAQLAVSDLEYIFAGDLLNQCISSAFALRDCGIPYFGLYGACSTMGESMSLAAMTIDGGYADKVCAITGSHFCSSERQYRFPLEYGGQRSPTAQWTVTGASAAMVSGAGEKNCPRIEKAIIGRVVDKGVTDAGNMGAAMAPAAAQTIADFLNDTRTAPSDYDIILTGDLGKVGSELLYELTESEYGINIREKHNDAGMMMYYTDGQDVHSGGSGCACCGTVMCSKILSELNGGTLRNALIVATGALLSTVSSFQGESIPSVAHGILISGKGN